MRTTLICLNYELTPVKVNKGQFEKRVKQTLPPKSEQYGVMMLLLDSVKEVCAHLDQVKPFIVKGRERRPDAPPTKERTIDHTGTCPICGKNVKMASGRLVVHGFRVLEGWGRNGKCFGVGYEPIEVSTTALTDYLQMLEERRAANPATTANLEHRLNTLVHQSKEWHKVLQYIRHLDNELRYLPEEIENMKKKISEWQPKPLPGERTK